MDQRFKIKWKLNHADLFSGPNWIEHLVALRNRLSSRSTATKSLSQIKGIMRTWSLDLVRVLMSLKPATVINRLYISGDTTFNPDTAASFIFL